MTTKEMKLEECVNLLSAGAAAAKNKTPPPHVQNALKMNQKGSKSDVRSQPKVSLRLLDDVEVLQCEYQSHHKGQYLMDFICRQLNIAEKDYFGLRFVDSSKQRHWMDLGKSIAKQLKDRSDVVCFRFKFYPHDPMLLKEEVTRYQLVLQLRRDILHGRLYSTLSDMATLASFILQSELGDYDPETHTGNYAGDYELVSRQLPELEEKAMELHQKLKGLTPSEADILFLKKASSLDTYGIDPHPVKDQQGEQIYLGINHAGISTFQGSRRSTHYKWSHIAKLNYEGKMFILHVVIIEDNRNKKKETVGFKCQNSNYCKYLWRCAVEQRLFFNCGRSTDIPSSVRGGGIFGSRFRYSGRVQREILEDPGPLRAVDGIIHRTPLYRSLNKNRTRSLHNSPLTLGLGNLGYGSLPRSNHSAPPNDTCDISGNLRTLGSSTSLPLSTLSSPYCPEPTLPLLETLQEDSPRSEDKELENNEEGEEEEYSVVNTNEDESQACNKIENGSSYIENNNEFGGATEEVTGPFSIYEEAKPKDIMNDTRLRDSKISEVMTPTSNPMGFRTGQNAVISILKIFIVCFTCVLIALFIVAIVSIEVDTEICQKMRSIPEVEAFQLDFYEPLKNFIKVKTAQIIQQAKSNFKF